MNKIWEIIKLLFNSLIVTINVLFVLLLIASAYSDHVSPDSFLFFSYLGLAFPILCVVNLCFVFYWMFVWEWRYLLIGVVGFFICWGPVQTYFPFHRHLKEVPKENTIKVLTYNVMGFDYKNHTKEEPNPILKYIAESGADIVCLQEYAVGKSDKFLTSKKVYNALKMYPYRSVIPIRNAGVLTVGIAVFSKYPISNSRRIKYDSDSNASSIHELKVNGKKLTLINNHLESFKLTMEDRSRYTEFVKHLNAETFDEARGALTQKLGTAFQIRAKQAEAIAAEVAKAKSDYIMVCGDFNDTPISYAHHTIQGDLLDAYAEAGQGMGVTYNRNIFWFRIDHILHSSNMKAINTTVDKFQHSDHYPLWSYLQLTEN